MLADKSRGRSVWLCLLMFLVALPAAAVGDDVKTPKTNVADWLVLGPIASPLPAFDGENGSATGAADVLSYEHLATRDMTPVAGAGVRLIGGGDATWSRLSATDDTATLTYRGEAPNIVYLATYVHVPRWVKVDVTARATQPFVLTVDEEQIIEQKKSAGMDEEQTGTAKLKQGKHLLLVKTVYVPGDSAMSWQIGVGLSAAEGFDTTPVLSLDPKRTLTIADILDPEGVGSVAVSPDGELVHVTMSRRTPPEGSAERWSEVRRIKDGTLVRTLKDMSGASDWQWAPTGRRLSYQVDDEGKGTIRVMDVETGDVETIVRDVEDLAGYDWSPTGEFIVYSVAVEAKKDETGVKRYIGLSDRRLGERDRRYLYLASVPAGTTRRLTAGDETAYLHDISPDGRSLLVERTHEELSKRPYSRSELVRIDMQTHAADTISIGSWFGTGTYAPDGKTILITASPSAFDGAGSAVGAGVIPNDYDTQAYIIDPATGAVDPITKNFDPTVIAAYWSTRGHDVYIVAEAGEYIRMYRYNVKKREYKEYDLGFDMVHGRDFARDEPVAVAVGSSANQPRRLYRIDLRNGRTRMLLDPAADRFATIEIGSVESWDFTTSDGKHIVGRIHYPPGFDASKKWPCIVYYYGGTSPVGRSFGGRYPKNLWAAHGYVVYVLQPSGATGFGQEFSALHVNDWGKVVSGEIIEGTEKFLDAHDFVDRDRVGCIGASFGGFMTELLVTRTDMFAAAVSHAGISSISSYWGEGYWGYGYNSVSAANSFPWNRPDIYIDQSPLFAADKVVTPLLLLHGSADTNVPPGESDQMYAALKLLGKEVEYISVEGQNHWIVDYKKRIVWSDAIISWFDRWLKDEPEWWNDMYPQLDE